MTRVLVVDDSSTARTMVGNALRQTPGFTVVGEAPDALEAQKLIATLRPDVLTLDVAMPGMNGLDLLQWLNSHHRTPAIVLSAITPTDSKLALRALDLGAAAVICKPGPGRPLAVVMDEVRTAVQAAAGHPPRVTPATAPALAGHRVAGAGAGLAPALRRHLIAVGASTGGTKALEVLLSSMPQWSPGMAIVQHMPAGFTTAFAERLNHISAMTVREARDGDVLTQGTALVAPGGYHLELVRGAAGGFVARLHEGAKEHHQRPAVDVLFRSVAKLAPTDAVGVLLTGMGADGATGLKAMRDAGSHTIAQDEATCVVFGMPGAAVKLNAAQEVLPLPSIAEAVIAAATARPGVLAEAGVDRA